MKQISKLLIANRGEIACRVASTAHRLGLETVSVYSDIDKYSNHVKVSDEAFRLGPAPPSESYLCGSKIIDIAKKSGSQAIHPGYGFLSENVEFASMCEENGIVFVGPPKGAIRDMGIKSTSKIIMENAGVPVIQGYHGEDQAAGKLALEASRIGYPIMIKAVRGGGGKGMRIAMNADEFPSQLQSAKTEALKAFGDDIVLLEKYIQSPRHIEVQVFGDSHGNYVYLNERDCSVQRRHQKVIEEAPAPLISKEMRVKLGEAAVKAAKAVNYVGAGTVEFIVDSKTLDLYFMEMNTRLQVEHGITELITDTDLVEWQLKVASGQTLPIKFQADIPLKGWAFEARIYAEDPSQNFMPGAGLLKHLKFPEAEKSRDHEVRIDTGVSEGDSVSVHYDPMIAKLLVWASDRKSSLMALKKALSECEVSGLTTNIPFLMKLCECPDFIEGHVDTDFIPQHMDFLFPGQSSTEGKLSQGEIENLSISSISLQLKRQMTHEIVNNSSFRNFRLNCLPSQKILNSIDRFKVRSNHFTTSTEVKTYATPNTNNYTVEVATKNAQSQNTVHIKNPKLVASGSPITCTFTAEIGNSPSDLKIQKAKIFFDYETPNCIGKLHVFMPCGEQFTCEVDDIYARLVDDSTLEGGTSTDGKVMCPMPGVIERVEVKVGDSVTKGQTLLVMIAMKMEYVIKAPFDGDVEQVLVKDGEFGSKGKLLVKLTSPL